MGSYDTTTMNFALKRMFSDRRVATAGFNPKNSFVTMMRKNTNFGGDAMGIPVEAGGPAGESHTYATAATNKSGPEGKQFLITVGEDFVLSSVAGKLIATTRGNGRAFLKAMEAAVESGLKRAGRRLAIEAYGDGTGKRGVVGTISTATFPLTVAADIVRFAPNQVVHAYTSAGVDHGTAKITNINYATYSITVDAIGSLAAGDYLYIDGDKANARKGWLAWNPTTAPTSGDSFFSVDRSSYPDIYSGQRLSSTKTTIHEKLIDLINQASRFGCETDSVFVNTSEFGDLVIQLDAKVQYVESAKKGFGSDALQIYGATGKINVFPDIDAPKGHAFGCKLDVWELMSAGGPSPGFLDFDGLGRFVREAGSDGYEIRIGGYDQIVCYDPTQIWHCATLVT